MATEKYQQSPRPANKHHEGWRANKVREEAAKSEAEQERELRAKLLVQALHERYYPLEDQNT